MSRNHNNTPLLEPFFICSSLLPSLKIGKQLSRALSLLQQAKEKGFPLDVYLYTSAMDACAKAGSCLEVLSLFRKLQMPILQTAEVSAFLISRTVIKQRY
jgi:pentatricopeptide repeat protein